MEEENALNKHEKRRCGRSRKTDSTKKALTELVDTIDLETGELTKRIALNAGASVYDKQEYIKHLREKEEQERKQMEKEHYRQAGKRDKHFAQCTEEYETKIIGKYNAKMLQALIRLVVHMNYTHMSNGTDIRKHHNFTKPIRSINNQRNANFADLQKIMGVSRPTAISHLQKYEKDGIIHSWRSGEKKEKNYAFTGKVFLRGKKENDNYFTKKIVIEELNRIIKEIDTYVDKERKKAKRYKQEFKEFYPLALFAALIPKFHWKTCIVVNNSRDELVKDSETIHEVLKSDRKKRRFQFPKKYELWNEYSGQNIKKIGKREIDELKACFECLTTLRVIGIWKAGKNPLILVNPEIIYVSPNKKYDKDWRDVIQTLFDLAK